MRRHAPQILVILCVLAGLVALRIADPAPIAYLRILAFDTFQQIKPRRAEPAGPAVVIDIDEESLRRVGQWPWPRTIVARLIERLGQAGSAAIGVDLFFSEPDRLSPENLLSYLPPERRPAELEAAARALPSNDDVLMKAISATPVVLGLVLDNGASAAPAAKAGFAHAGDDPKLFAPHYSGAIASLPALNGAAKGLGAINWIPERDQVVRRVPLVLRAQDQMLPSLSLEALRVAQGASTIIVKSSGASGETSFGAKTGINTVRAGEFEIPTDANGQMWVYFAKSQANSFIPAWQVLEGSVGSDRLEGRIALIGTSAAGLLDLRATPLEAAVPGIEVHAQAIEQIITGNFLNRPDFANALELFYLVAAGLLIGFLIMALGAQWSGVVAAAAIAAVIGGSWYAFSRQGWLLDPIYPALAVLILYLTSTVFAYVRTEGERNRVRSAFGRYLAPSLVEQLAANPAQLALGGETRDMTLMFCDIHGFTRLAEGLDAEALVRLMNRFLSPMTQVILDHHGTVDKYMGDCIMAFWNAPIDDDDHARHGARAAVAMISALDALNAETAAEADASGTEARAIRVGIGVNTGDCHVGNMGSDLRFDYSVIGDNVNVASRLEGQSRTYRVPIIFGERTAMAVPEMPMVELDLVAVKGKAAAERIYTPLAGFASPYDEDFLLLKADHMALLEAYRARDWDKAQKKLAVCRKRGAKELRGYYEMLKARIGSYRKTPPASGWGGVHVADSK